MPYLLFTPYHSMYPPIKGPSIAAGKFRSILATIYNQSQLAERKRVARYWSISAAPVSAHPSPLVITTKLAAAILVVVIVRRRGSSGPVLPLWLQLPLALPVFSVHNDNNDNKLLVMGSSKNLRVFNFAILLKSQKFDAHMFYSTQ